MKNGEIGTIRTINNAEFFDSAESYLAQGSSVELLLKGFSMRPFLRSERDVVVLTPIRAEELRRGMVVLFRFGGRHILHRFRGCDKRGRLKMEGDGNYRTVELVGPKDVLAYVTEVKRDERVRMRYGSAVWRLRSCVSLAIKRLRTLAISVKRRVVK